MESGSEEPPVLLGSLRLCFRSCTVSDLLNQRPLGPEGPRAPQVAIRARDHSPGEAAQMPSGSFLRNHKAAGSEGAFLVPSVGASPLGLFDQTVRSPSLEFKSGNAVIWGSKGLLKCTCPSVHTPELCWNLLPERGRATERTPSPPRLILAVIRRGLACLIKERHGCVTNPLTLVYGE